MAIPFSNHPHKQMASSKTWLLTGAAGFIGMHTCLRLLERGDRVIGLDNLNNYYDVSLKQDRLARLQGYDSFQFHLLDIVPKRLN